MADDALALGADARGLTADDRFAIQELVARFAHCSDYRDWDGLAKLYVREIVTELQGMSITYAGIAAQIEHAKVSDQQAQGKNRHFNFNLYIEEAEGRIVAQYYFINANAGATPMAAQIVVTGRMRDTVVKTGEGWKIAHRLVSFDQRFDLDF